MAGLKCIVVTPEKTALDQAAAFVVVPLYDGEFGIGPGHAPVIGRLGFGELRIRQASGTTDRYYVDGGFVQVVDDVVTVLTGRLLRTAEVDASVARRQLEEAMQRPVTTDELLQLRDRAVDQARAQLRIAERQRP
jgi:F-type H+-transporting ATPase subunit epsilon